MYIYVLLIYGLRLLIVVPGVPHQIDNHKHAQVRFLLGHVVANGETLSSFIICVGCLASLMKPWWSLNPLC
jgi:hypothetical protein